MAPCTNNISWQLHAAVSLMIAEDNLGMASSRDIPAPPRAFLNLLALVGVGATLMGWVQRELGIAIFIYAQPIWCGRFHRGRKFTHKIIKEFFFFKNGDQIVLCADHN